MASSTPRSSLLAPRSWTLLLTGGGAFPTNSFYYFITFNAAKIRSGEGVSTILARCYLVEEVKNLDQPG